MISGTFLNIASGENPQMCINIKRLPSKESKTVEYRTGKQNLKQYQGGTRVENRRIIISLGLKDFSSSISSRVTLLRGWQVAHRYEVGLEGRTYEASDFDAIWLLFASLLPLTAIDTSSL